MPALNRDAGSETKAAKNAIGMMAEVPGVLQTVLNQSGDPSTFTQRLCKGNLDANRRHIVHLGSPLSTFTG